MLLPTLLAALAGAAAPALAAPGVGVSVNIAQPGVYGRIDIGNVPPPALVYSQPVVVQPAPRAVAAPPAYLWVPPGHQRNWSRYCARYGACGVPVYFVQDRWYREHVLPRRAGPPGYGQPVYGRPGYGQPGHGQPVYGRPGYDGRPAYVAGPDPTPGYGYGPRPGEGPGRGPGWRRDDDGRGPGWRRDDDGRHDRGHGEGRRGHD